MLVLDIQGTQSLDHRDRGVAGYIREAALTIEARRPDAVAAYALNPDLLLPGGVEPLIASGKLRRSDEIQWSAVDILHVMSPYELDVDATRLVPPGFGGRLVVTLFDLVSEVLADQYLADPGLRRRYRARHELVRHADLVLAISEAARRDAVDLLGVPASRISVVPLAPAERFRPTTNDVRGPYVLYTGGTDHRKNVERLLEAWGALPDRVRSTYDLVIACNVKPLERNHFEVMADRMGFRDGLQVTGWVTDDDMVRLVQRASLAVYPPLYEGYGLPVAEALACSTPAIASNTSSLPELLPAEALFDPYDVADMSRAIERALTDRPHRDALLRFAREAKRRTYDDVADETLAAYETLSLDTARRHRRVGPQRRRVAFVSPLPPVPGGVSDYSRRLVEGLTAVGGDHIAVDVYVDGAPHERDLVLAADCAAASSVRPLAALERVEALLGPYDDVVVALGNSERHTGALDLVLRRHDTTVLAHDVRLTTLHRFAQWQHPAAVDGSFHDALHRLYPGLPSALGRDGAITPTDAERWGVWMAHDVIRAAKRFLVMSQFAANVAALDADPRDREKIAVIPFGVTPLGADIADVPREDELIASFGVVNELKQVDVLVDALESLHRDRHPDARLVFVGPASDDEEKRLRARGVEVTGHLSDRDYRRWLARATVAVQLRGATNGETSAATADCLAAGVPTIVTGIGAARELPATAVVSVASTVTGADLAAAISSLLSDRGRRAELGRQGRAFAAARSFERAAAALYELLSV